MKAAFALFRDTALALLIPYLDLATYAPYPQCLSCIPDVPQVPETCLWAHLRPPDNDVVVRDTGDQMQRAARCLRRPWVVYSVVCTEYNNILEAGPSSILSTNQRVGNEETVGHTVTALARTMSEGTRRSVQPRGFVWGTRSDCFTQL